MATLGSYALAADARDAIVDLVEKTIDEVRPGPAYAIVQDLSPSTRMCQIVYVGDATQTAVWVPMPSIQPVSVGQVVRVEGVPGDRYVTAVLGASTVADVVAPAAPVNVSVSTATDYTFPHIIVSWTPGDAKSAFTYLVQYRQTGVTTWEQVVTPVNATTVRLYPLAKDTQYEVRVTAMAFTGGSTTSASVFITTGHDTTAPTLATTVNALVMGWRQLSATWSDIAVPDVANNQGSWRIQVSTVNTFASTVVNRVVSGLGQVITGLSDLTLYYVRVAAIDLDGNQSSTWSNIVSGTTLGNIVPADGLAPTSSPTPVVVAGIGFLYASWAAVANANPVTYEVHISTTTGFTPSGATKVTEVTDLFVFIRTLADGVTPLTYGTTYYIKIIAKDSDGSAGAGTQGSGVPFKANTPDIAANSITAASGIIANAAIGNAQIADVSATKITAGSISAQTITMATNGIIQSSNYVAATSGYKLWTDGSGVGQFECNTGTFRNVTISGTLTTGSITGWLTTGAGGGFRTAASGKRIEITSTDLDRVTLWPSSTHATTSGHIQCDSTGTPGSTEFGWIQMQSPTINSQGDAFVGAYGRSHDGTVPSQVALGADQTVIYGQLRFLVAGIPTGGKIEQAAWQTPTFQNSWANFGTPWQTARYMKDSMGFVHMEGLITNSGSPTTVIFTLPSGYRPTSDRLFHVPAFGGGGLVRVDIQASTGNVTAVTYHSGAVAAYVELAINFATF